MDHLTEPEMRAYRDRTLEAESLLRAGGHIAECEDCRRKLRLLVPAASGIQELRAETEAHLSAEQLQQMADGILREKDRRKIEQHLNWCAECRTDLESLRRFAAEWKKPAVMAHRGAGRWWLAVAAAVLVASGILLLLNRPRVVVAFQDEPGRVTLDSRGHLTGVGALTDGQVATIRRVLRGGEFESAASLAKLQPAEGALMGSAAAPQFHLESPLGTAVSSVHPSFHWTAWAPDAAYVVTVKNLMSGQVIGSPSLAGSEWTPTVALQPGTTYEWQVAATLHGQEEVVPRPPAPPARFQVVKADQINQLEHLPPSHLARAILFAESGLLDQADQEAKSLAASNPGSTAAADLLKRIEALRHARP